MKTRKIRFLSLLAVATLLVTCFCSTLSVSAENWTNTGAPMQTASITFKGMGLDGSLGDSDTTFSVTMYNEYRTSAKGVGTHNSTHADRFVMISDRFAGFSTVNLWSMWGAYGDYNATNMQWFIVDWDREDRRFEIVDVYAYGTARAPVIPQYGFVVTFWRAFADSYNDETPVVNAVKAGLAAGNEYVVEVNLDDMVEVITDRAGAGYEYTCYEELLLDVGSQGLESIKAGTASLAELENITISSVDTYETIAGATKPHASSQIKFHPTAFNAAPSSDGIALFDSTEAYDAVYSGRAGLTHFFALEPVAGKENTYKVSANYKFSTSNWTVTEGTKPTAVPEGGYILVLSHYLSHKMRYNKAYDAADAYTNRVASAQYKNIDTYFAKDKEFVIDIKAAVKTIDAGQVRFDNPTGLRFKTQITGWKKMVDDGYTLEAGTLIMPKDLLNGTAFTVAALDAAGKAYLNIEQTKWVVDPTESNDVIGEMNAAIVNIKEGNYGRQFAARGYVKATKDGVTEYLYSDTITYRSVREVADAALADEECDTKYSDYLQEILRGFATPVEA